MTQLVLNLILWVATLLVAAALSVPIGLRWLRVAQREHYSVTWVSRIAWLWLWTRTSNALVIWIVLLFAIFATVQGGVLFAVVAMIVTAFLPFGLGIRGVRSKLAWTPRLTRLACAWAILAAVASSVLAVLLGPAAVSLVLLAAAPLMDLALAITGPFEKRLANKHLVSARNRLQDVHPIVVAITGSYGKTSTSTYLTHVLGGTLSAVASGAGRNTLADLAQAVNERLVPGTEVFIAETGTTAPGEIREQGDSFPPDIAALTAIGEARLGSREATFRAMCEITERAGVVVLPIDDPLLAGLADQCRAQGKRVVSVSTVPGAGADVVVDESSGIVSITENGAAVTAPISLPNLGHAVNLAVTIGIAVALEVPLATISSRLDALPDSSQRAQLSYAPSGAAVIDDTYNANPIGAERALRGASELASIRGGNLVVVTPGLIELGSVQEIRNEAFGRSIADAGGYLFAVARTNRKALVAGASKGVHPVRTFATRQQAVAAALDQAGDRGVVLYENDLPDHYP